jgi:hypothetical protein
MSTPDAPKSEDDAVPDLYRLIDVRSERLNDANSFVTERQVPAATEPISSYEMEVGMTDACSADPDQSVLGSVLRHRHVPDFELPVLQIRS